VTGGAISGSAPVSPTKTTTYTITCSNNDPASAQATTKVRVINPKIFEN
jgi:hypothetical protein